jgi:hypothetical protein
MLQIVYRISDKRNEEVRTHERKRILENKACGCGLDASGSRQGFCEHDNEPSGSIKDGGFLDLLSDYKLLKKYSSMELVYSSLTMNMLLTQLVIDVSSLKMESS